MIRTKLSLFAVLAALAAPALGTAAAPRTANGEPAKEKFYVYGGSCSRSIRLQGTYEDIRDALEAAQKYRTEAKLRFVTVRTGAHDRDYFGNGATHYKVYRKIDGRRAGCGNWFLQATVSSAAEAKKVADKLQTGLSPVEIVGHYAAK
jgi:hypothetical protein